MLLDIERWRIEAGMYGDVKTNFFFFQSFWNAEETLIIIEKNTVFYASLRQLK